jgi:hypothetical protein
MGINKRFDVREVSNMKMDVVSNTRGLNTWKIKFRFRKILTCHLSSQSFILAFVLNPEEDIPWIKSNVMTTIR